MTIGERIKLIREERKLSMAAFGEVIKMTSSNISKMEKGQRTVTDRTIALICEKYDYNESWLRTGQGEKFKTISTDEELINIVMEVCMDDREEVKKAIKTIAKLNEEQLDILLQFMEMIKKAPQ